MVYYIDMIEIPWYWKINLILIIIIIDHKDNYVKIKLMEHKFISFIAHIIEYIYLDAKKILPSDARKDIELSCMPFFKENKLIESWLMVIVVLFIHKLISIVFPKLSILILLEYSHLWYSKNFIHLVNSMNIINTPC